MYTQCPECDAIFQLSAEQLKAANGDVRCGQCLSVFNALDHLSETLPLAKEQNEEVFEEDLVWDEPAEEPAEPAEEIPAAGNDVFNEVVSEAHTHNVSKEEIDRFEEFLDSDASPVEEPIDSGLPTEGPLSAADFLPTQAPAPATSSFALEEPAEDGLAEEIIADDAIVDEQILDSGFDAESLEDDEADDTGIDLDIAEVYAEKSTEENLDVSSDDIVANVEAPIVETAPIDVLAFEALARERAEDEALAQSAAKSGLPEKAANSLDALRKATESLAQKSSWRASEPDEPVVDNGLEDESIEDASVPLDLTAEVNTDDEEFAELDAYLHDTPYEPARPSPATKPAESSDNEQIIIEESDLEPVHSSSFTDTTEAAVEATAEPVTEASVKQASASAPAKAQPTEAPPAPLSKNKELVHIPSVLLDDLHAAKAESLRPPSTPWVVGSVVLMLALVLQVAYFSRDELAKDPSLRPWLVSMCNILDCTVRTPYDIKQIEIIGRDVRSHPTAKKALIVSTSIINNADFVQPYPLLLMTFSDMTGTLVAQRRFTPREYLKSGTDVDAGMTPNLPVKIELELVDPGQNAVNYEFRAEQDPRQTRPLS